MGTDQRATPVGRVRRALIIGNPDSVFPRELAALWRSRGIDVAIVTRYWRGGETLPDGTAVLTSGAHEGRLRSLGYRWLQHILERFERLVIYCQRRRYERAIQDSQSYRPTFTASIVLGLSISRFVRKLRPDVVAGQEAFTYGLATAWCRDIPRILMPWGGDIFTYCDTTSIASRIVTYAMQHVDLVVTGAVSSMPYIASRFGVEPARIHYSGLWRLDRGRFRPAESDERRRIRQEYGIPAHRLVVMNVRRFLPGWGSDVVLEAFLRFAIREPAAHFVILGGAGTEAYTDAARERIDASGLADRFVILDGELSLARCAELMSASDIFVSLMRKRDMRSASVLQAAAAGAVPVVGDQAEYRYMEQAGFRALFVDSDDASAVVAALEEYARDPEARRAVVAANQAYFDAHEDGDAEAQRLLDRVDHVLEEYRVGTR